MSLSPLIQLSKKRAKRRKDSNSRSLRIRENRMARRTRKMLKLKLSKKQVMMMKEKEI